MKVLWRKSLQRGYSEEALLGRWVVGGIWYDGTRPRGSKSMWAAHCTLPGRPPRFGRVYETPETAKERVEDSVRRWLIDAGVQQPTSPPTVEVVGWAYCVRCRVAAPLGAAGPSPVCVRCGRAMERHRREENDHDLRKRG